MPKVLSEQQERIMAPLRVAAGHPEVLRRALMAASAASPNNSVSQWDVMLEIARIRLREVDR